MISDYEYRELFTDPNAIKDVLLVPQGCKVFTSSGQFPTVLKWNEDEQAYTDDPDFIITNDNIYKEKMKLVESINSADNLAFGSCEPSQIRFTIRNEKYIDEEEEDPELKVKSVIPPLTKTYEENGEVFLYKAVIKYYIFFNGDSDTLFYVGMFQVEEDKMSNDGKTREITAYDYLYTLRDMDIFEWYKTLFTGLWSDTNSDDEEEEPEPQPGNGENSENNQNSGDQNNNNQSTTASTPHVCIRPGQEKWSILAAFEDLYNQTAIYYPDDAKSYPGYAMKWALDDVVFSDSNKNFVNMNYSFTENPKIMNDGSLSFGKFMEDMGLMLGAYPKFIRGNPATALKETHSSFYNIWDVEHEQLVENWETVMHDCCKFTFVKLPKNSKTVDSGNTFMDSDLVNTGLQQPDYEVRSIELIRAINYNNEEIDKYVTGWSKEEIEAYEKNNKDIGRSYTHYTFKDSIFFSQYLIDYKDYNKEVESSAAKTRVKAMLKNVYGSLKYRTYRPYELKTVSDLCRETGDLIMVKTEFDPLNKVNFVSYILEREVEGIQKMIETLKAKGDNGLPNFGNYKSGSSYTSGSGGGYVSGAGTSTIGGYTTTSKGTTKNAITPNDLVELIRNLMFHLLDEPNVTKAKVNRKKGRVAFRWEDPEDIKTNEPVPATWAGTIVVRKEGSAPLHRWDGTLIVDSTERDYYKNKTLYDNNVEGDKIYYYGIFPYDTEGHYRWTKIIKIDTTVTPESPIIESVVITGGVNATLTFAIPQDTNYQHCYIVYMKDEIPTSINDGDKVEIPDSSVTTFQVKDLEPESTYYFKIMTTNVDTESKEASAKTLSSNIKWLFKPDFDRGGIDSVHYDANDVFLYNNSQESKMEYSAGTLVDEKMMKHGDEPGCNVVTTVSTTNGEIVAIGDYPYNTPRLLWEFGNTQQREEINGKANVIISVDGMLTQPLSSEYDSYELLIGLAPLSYNKPFENNYSAYNYPWHWYAYRASDDYPYCQCDLTYTMFAKNSSGNNIPISSFTWDEDYSEIVWEEDGVSSLTLNEWHTFKYVLEVNDVEVTAIKYYVDDTLLKVYDKNSWSSEYSSRILYFFNTLTDFTKLGRVYVIMNSKKVKIRNVSIGYQNDNTKNYWNGEEVTITEIGSTGRMTVSNNHEYDTYKIYSGPNVIYQFNYSAWDSQCGGSWLGLGDTKRYVSFIINDDEKIARPYILTNASVDSENECAATGYDFPSYQEMRQIYDLLKDNVVEE